MRSKKSMEQTKHSKKIKSNKVTTDLENEDCKKGGKVDFRKRGKGVTDSSVKRPSYNKVKGYSAKPKHSNDEIPEAPEDGPEL